MRLLKTTLFLLFFLVAIGGLTNTQASGIINKESSPDDPVPADSVKEEKDFPLTFGFDLVSRYVWRGVDFGVAPAFQPGLSYSISTKKTIKGDIPVFGFEIGAWASYAVTGSFAETDLYATLSFPYVWVGLIDYYFPTETISQDKYIVYSKNTNHVFEALVGFDGPEKAPIYGFFAYNFHGHEPTVTVTPADSAVMTPADTSVSDDYTGWKNSFYFELGYPFSLRRDVSLDIFVGGAYGWYYTQNSDFALNGLEVIDNQKFNIVNVGIKVSKTFELGKHKIQLPLSASLIANPDAKKFYFVAGIGIWNQ